MDTLLGVLYAALLAVFFTMGIWYEGAGLLSYNLLVVLLALASLFLLAILAEQRQPRLSVRARLVIADLLMPTSVLVWRHSILLSLQS